MIWHNCCDLWGGIKTTCTEPQKHRSADEGGLDRQYTPTETNRLKITTKRVKSCSRMTSAGTGGGYFLKIMLRESISWVQITSDCAHAFDDITVSHPLIVVCDSGILVSYADPIRILTSLFNGFWERWGWSILPTFSPSLLRPARPPRRCHPPPALEAYRWSGLLKVQSVFVLYSSRLSLSRGAEGQLWA